MTTTTAATKDTPPWRIFRGFMIYQLVIAPVALALGMVPWTATGQTTQPSLAETLAWMEKTFNPHEGMSGYGEYAEYSSGKLYNRITETFDYDGCKMTLHEEEDPNVTSSPKFWYTSRVYSFNLRDIDPTSMEILRFASKYGGIPCVSGINGLSCDMVTVFFKTTDREPLIEDEATTRLKPGGEGKGFPPELHGKRKNYGAFFYLNDVEYAGRFVNAFRHAISLCGGKPSPF